MFTHIMSVVVVYRELGHDFWIAFFVANIVSRLIQSS